MNIIWYHCQMLLIIIIFIYILTIRLTSLGIAVGTDPVAECSSLSTDSGGGGDAVRMAPGDHTNNGGADRQGATRVTLKFKQGVIEDNIKQQLLLCREIRHDQTCRL